MAYRSLTFATIVAVASFVMHPIITLAYGFAESFFRAVMLMPAKFDWRAVADFSVATYRKIADLKPVYRESYATHGLSLSDGRAG
ncbi:hypothetical protein [Shinella zoogloeoides]|uniref:hypothetical protein n=1 Tax=Shinella zoogloeoides TaxID=352475 RepID=UPI0028AE1F5C|nr:hypothetical protein [Shinella zoogloeoides]